MNKTYHIIDWAGNIMFNNKQFKSSLLSVVAIGINIVLKIF